MPAHKENGTVYELFEEHSQEADDAVFDAVLARVPDVPPMEGDEIIPS